MKYDTNSKKLMDSVVCFIDILGFSNMIIDEFSEGNGQDLLDRLHRRLNEAYFILKESHRNEGAIKIFTDNIVIGKPIRNDGESELGHLLDTIASYQFQLALEGLFVRGGITVGMHYMDDDVVFGPALIKAYNLESQKANVPRVVLSEEAVELVKEHINYYSIDYSTPQQSYLLIDSDGQWFINYLQAAIIDEQLYDSSIRWMNQHKANVEEKLEKNRKNSKVFSKYRWIAQYHNFFCRYNFQTEDDLIINNSMMLDEPRRIERTTDAV